MGVSFSNLPPRPYGDGSLQNQTAFFAAQGAAMAIRALPANFPRDGAESCGRCASDSLKDFNGELAVHFPGLDGLTKPIVWVFPKLTICLHCGFAEFALPEEQRAQLGHDDFAAK